MRYRKEIDGLRALAVIPVILFHAGFEAFSGGYVGVDVFFVISGYLITTIILTEKEAGTFSFLNFYQRRARRILPALFFVILCCLPFVWKWMFPSQLVGFAKSLIAVSIFCSNIFFQKGSGIQYFAPSAEEMPLLHTWSLAVEEQYYIFFPLLIVLFWRFDKDRIFGVVILATIVSLGLAEWSSHIARHFYSSPKRAWEILVGAICAFHLLNKGDDKGSQWLSLFGIGLIIYAVVEFDRNTPFPSLYTLVPVLGAALIVLFGTQRTFVSRILSTPVLVGIGLISYSAYLWHYPLFAFARIRSLNEPSQVQYLLLSALSIALGWMTWRYIEQPFRAKEGNKQFISPRKVTVTAISGTFLFIIIGVVGNASSGFENRFNDQTLSILSIKKETPRARGEDCLTSKGFSLKTASCIYGSRDQVKLALLGDSHALSLAGELGKALDKRGLGVLSLDKAACLPIRGLVRQMVKPRRARSCIKYNETVLEYLKSSSIDTFVLLARWTLGIEGERFNNFEGGKETGGEYRLGVVGHTFNGSEENRKGRIATRYVEGIKEILALGKRVILVYPIPEAGWNVSSYLAKASIHGKDFGGMLSTSFEIFKRRNALTYSALDAIEHPNLIRVKPAEIFCDSYAKGRCLNQLNGVLLYYDDDHLSSAGAKLVVDHIVNAIHSTH